MKNGLEIIKFNILKQGLIFYEIQTPKGATVAAQMDELKPDDVCEELETVCEQLPAGRYSCILSKKCDKDNLRIKKGAGGTGYVELPLIIQGTNSHLDINSHNAQHTGINNQNYREFKDLLENIKALEKQVLKLEIENERLKSEKEDTGINGILNNPNTQMILATALQNFLSNNQSAK